jgi:hypothetical protein
MRGEAKVTLPQAYCISLPCVCPQFITVFTSRFLAAASTDWYSSASPAQVLLTQPPVQNSSQVTTQLTGSQAGGQFTPASESTLHSLTSNWTDNWTLSFTNQLLHVTSLNWTADNWQLSCCQSHIATDGQSVSKSWCRAPSGAHDQIFITVW